MNVKRNLSGKSEGIKFFLSIMRIDSNVVDNRLNCIIIHIAKLILKIHDAQTERVSAMRRRK